MLDVNTLNKGELVELARTHNIAYAGLNAVALREALAPVLAGTVQEPTVVAPTMQEAEQVVAPSVQEQVVAPEVQEPDPYASDFGAYPAGYSVQFVAPSVQRTKVAREEQYGVRAPGANTRCGEIWAWCNAQVAQGVRPEAKALRAALTHLDPTTCTVQYYRWRKFNGISGR